MTNEARELAFLFRATRPTRPMLLLGAGASYRSGVPLAAESVRRIARNAYARQVLGQDERFCNPKPSDWMPFLQSQEWFIEDPNRLAENFPLAVDHLLRPQEVRREFLSGMIRPANGISAGYHDLAGLIARRLCWTVLTTNFDSLIVEALRPKQAHLQEIVELNVTADDLVRFNAYNRCQIIYLHGSVEYYRDKNLVEETQRLDNKLVRLVQPLLKDSPLIVVGYRGSERSVTHHLLEEGARACDNYKSGIYWCVRRGEPLHENVLQLQQRIGGNFRAIEIEGFDELMAELARELEGETWYPGADGAEPRPQSLSPHLPFDQQPMEGAKLEDLDHDLILATLVLYCKRLKYAQVDQKNYLALMREQGLIVGRVDNPVPTQGCFLLFGRDVNSRFPYARVALTHEGKKRVVFEGNLITQYNNLKGYLMSKDVNPVLRIKGERTAEERPAYPERTLTELAVNFLVHRDYSAQGYGYVHFTPGRSLRFVNPGGLPPKVLRDVRLEEGGFFQPVRNATELRNSSLADIFFGLGSMDKAGSGLADVSEIMIEHGGRSRFAIGEHNDSVIATLYQPVQSDPTRTRVARRVSPFELYVTNLLPFSVMPEKLFILPLREHDLIDTPLFDPQDSPRELPIFITHADTMISFADWRAFPDYAGRRGHLDRMAPTPVEEYLGDEDQRRRFVWLLGKHWEFFLHRWRGDGLILERKKKRAFFTLIRGTKNVVTYDSRSRRNVRRTVVKRRELKRSVFHENEGLNYEVVDFAGNWAMQVKPFYMFTGKDGCTPLPSFARASKATRRMKFDRNLNVDDDLSFWARLLSGGHPAINIGGVGVDDLILGSEYCSVEVPISKREGLADEDAD
jgi:hypothetical protein